MKEETQQSTTGEELIEEDVPFEFEYDKVKGKPVSIKMKFKFKKKELEDLIKAFDPHKRGPFNHTKDIPSSYFRQVDNATVTLIH
ncbi:hypothetical protein [Adhaeribacter radiodurans]|uniref:Uncharacterized protein n=1 Tax=Adhaeribacter radiodurans TaxID=2745197 RepID=A0A7L7LCE5_9BACT|nr:hypothetical protein [Adhaeribacter radiodurans]QMU30516.1 hypothetical protein HUW48_21930 [Adhaeribacter radiodurans]